MIKKKENYTGKSVSKKIRKGDTVIAICGNYKGQSGTVLSCSGERVLVQGLNIRKKCVKKSEQAPNGQIIDLESPIHISNVKVCNKDGEPVKLKVQIDKKGERHLVYKDGNEEVVYRSLKKHNI